MNENRERAEDFDPEEEKLLELFRGMGRKKTGPSVTNTERLRDMAKAMRILAGSAAEAGGKVSYEINDPFPGMGYIRVIGKKLRFRGAEAFTEAAKLASNVEAYAMANGSVCLDFTFHGLTKKSK